MSSVYKFRDRVKKMFDTRQLLELNKRVSSSVITVLEQWTATYKKKNANYGNSWLLSGQTMSLWFPQGITLDTPRKFIMHGLIVRMLDKLIRAAHIELTSEKDKVGELSSDTFGDLGVYSFMASAESASNKATVKSYD